MGRSTLAARSGSGHAVRVNGYVEPDRPDQRLSDAEREAAVAELAVARAEGRLAPTEYEERAAGAQRARTRADLVPLFADLPDPSRVRPTSAPPTAAPVAVAESSTRRQSRALGGRIGDTIMALTPFLAVALFFITGFNGSFLWSWLWFLVIPVTAIIIYGPGGESRRSRD
jgi:hypothetical protein